MRKLPAYPLFVKDPYFSIWAPDDILNDSDTVFWHGEKKPMYGKVVADGKEYIFLGAGNGETPLKQITVDLTAFSTIYKFEGDAFDLNVEFLSPLPPDDLDTASCPVCFMRYCLMPKKHLSSVSIKFIAHEKLCYNNCFQEDRKENVRGGVMKFSGFESAFFGLLRQMPLSHSSDEIGADWGYYYLAGHTSEYFTEKNVAYISTHDDYSDVSEKISGHFLIGFDDLASIFYFGDYLKAYYFRNGKTITDALQENYFEADRVFDLCASFDADLKKRAERYGENYLLILYASLRQSMAAHKIVQDKNGRILFLSKECNSDGCIATTDVSYPSSPLYLLYNPELVNGMLRPIFDFARMPVWEFDFAPHDVGVYPYCLGQLYGALNQQNKYNSDIWMRDWQKAESLPLYYLYPKGSNLYEKEKQMPIEECGNMLILSLAASLAGGGDTLLYDNFDLLHKWTDYLCENGLFPANQLCTDDFAGHLANNSNLSLKACLGIAAFALICMRTGKEKTGWTYLKKARLHAEKWIELCFDGENPTSLTINGDRNKFSLKYNLIFDKLFGTHLFPESLYQAEIRGYLARRNKFGTPLDSRADYTKSDWIFWTAALSQNIEDILQMIDPIATFLRESPDRVPFADWYDTKTGKIQLFKNRTVQGAVFILLLLDENKLEFCLKENCFDNVNE